MLQASQAEVVNNSGKKFHLTRSLPVSRAQSHSHKSQPRVNLLDNLWLSVVCTALHRPKLCLESKAGGEQLTFPSHIVTQPGPNELSAPSKFTDLCGLYSKEGTIRYGETLDHS